jgi:DNA-binding SARP family transcriptional activator
MGTQAAVLEDTRPARALPRQRHSHAQRQTHVEMRLLGDFEVLLDGRTIAPSSWTRRHSAALVKLLALSPGRSLHREQVLDALWPDLDIETAAPRLHKAAHYARRVLGDRDAVVLSGESVRLYPEAQVHIDADQFQQAASSALGVGGVAAAKGALALHSGPLLPHDLYEPWGERHRLHLGRLYTELLHQAQDWHQALAADPSDETAHLALASRYAELGDRRAALRQLDELQEVVRRDLDAKPSTQATALRRQLTGDTGAASDGDGQCCASAQRAC